MRVLLVDHDSEALETITRAIRGVLELDCVTSKSDAMLLLRQNTYDVLIACERCEDGSGLDLLGRTTRTATPLKRIFAAAPERLQLLGPRLAPFKVQRTINYPIDLEELWLAIAQVTSDPNDETDGTIERVVLDERGIPATGSTPRAPIPPRPPAPLAEAVPTSAFNASIGRAATARIAQPAPEPPLRAPPPPRQPPQVTAPVARAPAAPNTTSDTGRMRAPAPPPRTTSDTGRMRSLAPTPPMEVIEPLSATGPSDFPAWTPEVPTEDDFAQVAEQARFGVQQRAANEASRRKRQRIVTAGGIALVVAGAIVFLIDRFYDPAARAREAAIAAKIEHMTEQQKVTDSLTLIEIDIENAIMSNELDKARRDLALLTEKAPDHPRRAFLQNAIDRADEVAKLSPQADGKAAQAAVLPAAAEQRPAASRPRAAERPAERVPERATRTPERTVAQRSSGSAAPPPNRSYGAPIGEAPRQSLPLNSPINSAPVTTVRRPENSFPGRTVEAGDQATGRTPPPAAPAPQPNYQQPPVTNGAVSAPPNASGSAAVPMPGASPPAPQAVPAPVDVVPAKIVKRVMPVPPSNLPRNTKGFVVVSFKIGTNGRVSDIEIVESEPKGKFDDAAQDAVRKWTYEPRKENGVAVESIGKARLVFEPSN
jgi:TonB family protein